MALSRTGKHVDVTSRQQQSCTFRRSKSSLPFTSVLSIRPGSKYETQVRELLLRIQPKQDLEQTRSSHQRNRRGARRRTEG